MLVKWRSKTCKTQKLVSWKIWISWDRTFVHGTLDMPQTESGLQKVQSTSRCNFAGKITTSTQFSGCHVRNHKHGKKFAVWHSPESPQSWHFQCRSHCARDPGIRHTLPLLPDDKTQWLPGCDCCPKPQDFAWISVNTPSQATNHDPFVLCITSSISFYCTN